MATKPRKFTSATFTTMKQNLSAGAFLPRRGARGAVFGPKRPTTGHLKAEQVEGKKALADTATSTKRILKSTTNYRGVNQRQRAGVKAAAKSKRVASVHSNGRRPPPPRR